ncbi:MAG: efflux RND transporter permease subunit, partial [bacterium]|nr:efflux RND transporter permease subunit [bacterium]
MWSRLIAFSIRNTPLVLFVALLVIGFGVYTFGSLPVDVYPDINDPRVTILTEAHGWSPEEMETLVTFPLESAFNGMPFVKRVRSSSGIGLSVVFIEFDWGTDIFLARQLVSERLQLVAPTLPEGVEAPIMGPVTSRLGEILEYAVVDEQGKYSPMALRDINDWQIRYRLQSLGGIANVINQGGLVKQYQVLVRPSALLNHDISLEEVMEALEQSNVNSAGGFYLDGTQEALIRGLGRLENLDDLRQVVVKVRDGGTPLLLQDVAEIRLDGQRKRRRGAGTLNGREAALGKISKQPGVNTLQLTAKIQQAFEGLRASLPEGISLRTEYVQADFIARAVNTVQVALLEGAILVVAVLLLFLYNLRTALITLLAIPLSLIATLLINNWLGLTVNIFTIAGLVVAVGMVVDNAIIYVENSFRRLREYYAHPTAEQPSEVVFRASNELADSIVFATLIITLVFMPLFALSGIEGRMFQPLGITVIIAMAVSLLVALTVTVALCNLLLTRQSLPAREAPVVRWIKRAYRPILHQVMQRHRWAIAVAVGLIVVAVGLLPFLGQEFLPVMDDGTLVLNATLPPGTNLETTQRIGKRLEQTLLKLPFVVSTSGRTGRAEGDEHAEGVNVNELLVNILPPEQRRQSMQEVQQEIRQALQGFPALINIGQPLQHRLDHLLSGVNAQLALKLFGPDLGVLRRKAREIEAVVATVPGVADLQVEQQVDIPQLQFRVNRAAAARYGLPAGKLAHYIETAFNGEVVSQILEGQRRYDLFLRLTEESISDLDTIRALRVTTPAGPHVPLGELADIRFAPGPNIINRENVSRRIVIQCNVSGRDLGSFVAEIQQKIAQQVVLPEGYFLSYGGQFESQQQATRQLIIQLAFVSVAMFLLLQLSLGSWRMALLVMLNLPLALVGGIVSVFFSGGTLSIPSLVGFILLFGIAVRNGIILIMHINDLRAEGQPLYEAILAGAENRISPVLMTALTTGLGMLPLALSSGSGAELQKPLAIVIVGGIFSSTVLTLLILPVFYYLVERRWATPVPATPT